MLKIDPKPFPVTAPISSADMARQAIASLAEAVNLHRDLCATVRKEKQPEKRRTWLDKVDELVNDLVPRFEKKAQDALRSLGDGPEASELRTEFRRLVLRLPRPDSVEAQQPPPPMSATSHVPVATVVTVPTAAAVTPPALLPLQSGVKQKLRLRPDMLARYGLPADAKLSVVKTGSGESYVMSHRLEQGTFGKFCLMTRFSDGALKGAKYYRTQPSRRPADWKTSQTSWVDICRELQQAGTTLPLHAVVAITEGDAEGKVIAVTDAMDGDLHNLNYRLNNDSVRRSLVWLATHKVALDLAEHHRNGRIHNDFKMANVLWNTDKTFKAIDLGLVRHVDPDTKVATGSGGTYPAPEQALNKPFTTAVDMWALGLMMCDAYMSLGSTPFFWRRVDGPDSQFPADFAAFHDSLRDKAGRIDAARLLRREIQTNEYGQYFAQVYEKAPEACQYALERLIVMEPTQRATAEQVAADAASHVPPLASSDLEALEKALDDVANPPKMKQLRQGMKALREALIDVPVAQVATDKSKR